MVGRQCSSSFWRGLRGRRFFSSFPVFALWSLIPRALQISVSSNGFKQWSSAVIRAERGLPRLSTPERFERSISESTCCTKAIVCSDRTNQHSGQHYRDGVLAQAFDGGSCSNGIARYTGPTEIDCRWSHAMILISAIINSKKKNSSSIKVPVAILAQLFLVSMFC